MFYDSSATSPTRRHEISRRPRASRTSFCSQLYASEVCNVFVRVFFPCFRSRAFCCCRRLQVPEGFTISGDAKASPATTAAPPAAERTDGSANANGDAAGGCLFLTSMLHQSVPPVIRWSVEKLREFCGAPTISEHGVWRAVVLFLSIVLLF